ncbi:MULTISPECIES: hypothetical protein [Nocardia]|uniref:hypothetical protein n=1 Tax=Nocardia TaxID=1817 RepID=UPI000D6986D2|nr:MULTISPECIES: hypothetical protein [Nocardia]
MWEWGKWVAEFATAATWTSWRAVETKPTILDPEYWETESGTEGAASSETARIAPESECAMNARYLTAAEDVTAAEWEFDLVG